MRSNSHPRAVMSSGMCQVRVSLSPRGVCPNHGYSGSGGNQRLTGVARELRVEGEIRDGGVPGMGEMGRHPPADFGAEGPDHMHVRVGVRIEEIPAVGVEVNVFDVDTLGCG